MGKGFMAHKGLVGQDLGQIVNLACRNHGLDVELRAIVNDSSASLLSRAYVQPSTRFSLIVGTGFNLAAYLPVLAIGRNKFGVRPDGWFDEASHVIVNTEASMFGRNILPLTRWDRQLLSALERPDFQPYEHLVSGMYLGEICRRILIEAIETSGVFGGVVPQSMEDPFSFGTLLASSLERYDQQPNSLAIVSEELMLMDLYYVVIQARILSTHGKSGPSNSRTTTLPRPISPS